LAGVLRENVLRINLTTRCMAQARALKNPSGERFVIVALDNWAVSRSFMEPALRQIADV
jgi:hypothetical protein